MKKHRSFLAFKKFKVANLNANNFILAGRNDQLAHTDPNDDTTTTTSVTTSTIDPISHERTNCVETIHCPETTPCAVTAN